MVVIEMLNNRLTAPSIVLGSDASFSPASFCSTYSPFPEEPPALPFPCTKSRSFPPPTAGGPEKDEDSSAFFNSLMSIHSNDRRRGQPVDGKKHHGNSEERQQERMDKEEEEEEVEEEEEQEERVEKREEPEIEINSEKTTATKSCGNGECTLQNLVCASSSPSSFSFPCSSYQEAPLPTLADAVIGSQSACSQTHRAPGNPQRDIAYVCTEQTHQEATPSDTYPRQTSSSSFPSSRESSMTEVQVAQEAERELLEPLQQNEERKVPISDASKSQRSPQRSFSEDDSRRLPCPLTKHRFGKLYSAGDISSEFWGSLSKKADDFGGKWQLQISRSDGIDSILRALGIGRLKRTVVSSYPSIVDVSVDTSSFSPLQPTVNIVTHLPLGVTKQATVTFDGNVVQQQDSDTGVWSTTPYYIDGRLLQRRESTIGVMYDIRGVFPKDPQGEGGPMMLFQWTFIPAGGAPLTAKRWLKKL